MFKSCITPTTHIRDMNDSHLEDFLFFKVEERDVERFLRCLEELDSGDSAVFSRWYNTAKHADSL